MGLNATPDPIVLALAAAIREIAERRTAAAAERRATMVVMDGRAGRAA